MAAKQLRPTAALRRLGFRQTARGAVIIGLIIGIVMGAQGPAYNEAYPTDTSRQQFVRTLDAAPALGFMAGETVNASRPASYSIYKSIVITTLITAIWGLLTTTRLLRGQEEDGRMELLLAGNVSKRQASLQLLLGFTMSLILSGLIAFIFIASLGQLPHVELAPGNAALLTLGSYLPALAFGGLGVFTSQLALIRGRAVMYGLVPLLLLFVVRGAANSVHDLNWLKRVTPFGWADLLNPVINPHGWWLIPPAAAAIVLGGVGLFYASRRDLGISLLRESETVKSHHYLLGSPAQLSLRLQGWTFTWWTVGTLAFVGFMTGLAKLSIDILKDASGAQSVVSKLGQTNSDMAAAFIGIGNLFAIMILLVMVALLIGAIRRDEAKGYLDNLLVQPVSRTRWLTGRLLLIAVLTVLIPIAASFVTWAIAHMQNLNGIELKPLFEGAFGSIAVLLFTLGIGSLVYGFLPRLAVAAVAITIAWSYALDIFKAIVDLPAALEKTSLLHYISTSPTAAPDWKAVAVLTSLGILLACIGLVGFAKRDVIAE